MLEQRIAQIPFIAKLIGIASHVLTYILPRQLLARTVKTFTGFPDNAVKTTVDFLASPLGVEQALYLLFLKSGPRELLC